MTGDEHDPQFLEKKIREYNKTGKFCLANTNKNQVSSGEITMVNSPKGSANNQSFSMTRISKLQRSNFFLQPKQMMQSIHKKTHFKAAISISRGDACCINVEQNEFGDQFAEIARNIEAMNRSAGDFGVNQGPKVG